MRHLIQSAHSGFWKNCISDIIMCSLFTLSVLSSLIELIMCVNPYVNNVLMDNRSKINLSVSLLVGLGLVFIRK